MSWDASDEDTWERWERERRARRAAGAAGRREVVVVDGETAAGPGGTQDRRRSSDPESLNPVYGLYDRLPHEEE